MKSVDMTGAQVGRLTVIERDGSDRRGQSLWKCRCVCGTVVTRNGGNLRSGNTTSCGCLRNEKSSERAKTHGMTHSPTFALWCRMRQRCTNPKKDMFQHYGGRGIKVCDRWQSFENFLADMGERPEGMSIERKDVNGDYEPGNCVWATQKEQMNNTRFSRFITYKGETKTLKQWSETLQMPYFALMARLDKLKWPIEKAFTVPIMSHSEAGKLSKKKM